MLDSNPKPLASEATTEPQPLPYYYFNSFSLSVLHKYPLLNTVADTVLKMTSKASECVSGHHVLLSQPPPSLNYWSHISLSLLSLSFFSISFPYSVFLFSLFLIILSLISYSLTLFVLYDLFIFLSFSLSSSFFLSKSA